MNNKFKKHISPTAIIIGAVLVLYTVIMFLLLSFGVINAVKNEDDFTGMQNYVGLPKDLSGKLLAPWQWEWNNFSTAFKYFSQLDFGRNAQGELVNDLLIWDYVGNTLLFAGVGAFVATLCPLIIAYATSKFNYKFNVIVDSICIITMIIPIVGSSMSMVSVLHQLHIYDTFIALFLQKFNYANMYYLMFGAIFKGVSKEYYEAAHVDGATEFTVMLRIAFPLVATSFGLIFLLFFIQYWNDYTTLMTYAPTHPTLSYALYKLSFTDQGDLNMPTIKLAGSVVIVLPVIILFIIFRNKIMGNLTIGGVKE